MAPSLILSSLGDILNREGISSCNVQNFAFSNYIFTPTRNSKSKDDASYDGLHAVPCKCIWFTPFKKHTQIISLAINLKITELL